MAKVVCIQQSPAETQALFQPSVEVRHVDGLESAVEAIRRLHAAEPGSDVPVLMPAQLVHSWHQCWSVFDLLPTGIAILDADNRIIAANQRLVAWFPNLDLTGLNFYVALGNPTILGPELSPLASIAANKTGCFSAIQVGDRSFGMHAIPLLDREGRCLQRMVSLIDSTDAVQERQKLEALHQAGAALADLRPEEISEMDFEQRTDLLKDNILHYTKDLLNFDVIEIRLIQENSRLEPLLSVGIDADQSKVPLFAKDSGNGVTGFVAAKGKSYLCEDTTNDPLYVKGLIGAKSSLTVPLIYHDKVIGTFNIESPLINAFSESDQKFVETFARDVAVALNTLNLLTAQQANAAIQSVEAIHTRVVRPIDDILNDTVHAIDAYQGSNLDVIGRLQDILRNAREIKQVIQRVGEQMVASSQTSAVSPADERPKLKDKKILVIDADEEIRTSAHNLLERYGCIVETAHAGREAILMIKNSGLTEAYDVIIADIRLPDIKGYELLLQLKSFAEEPPLILMTGYGYDPGHSIVKARQAGLRPNALLFKPFRLKQLLDTVEATVDQAVQNVV